VGPPRGATISEPSDPRAEASSTGDSLARLDPGTLGFLLAKASSRWNALLAERFADAGFDDVRPAYGSILLPLYAQDGLRMGDLAREARLAKQTMTTMVRLMERDGLVERRPDPHDRRSSRIFLTTRARAFEPVAEAAVQALTADVAASLGPDVMQALADGLRALMDLAQGAPEHGQLDAPR
jgi:DNA-binding MarR family transcriptional regulator